MDDKARDGLIEIVRTHGLAVCEDPKRCEGLVRDYCAGMRREGNVLVSALRNGVPAELLAAQPGTPVEVLLGRLARRLENDLGMATDAAEWAVEAWAIALGTLSAPTSRPPMLTVVTPSPTGTANPTGGAPPTPGVPPSSTTPSTPPMNSPGAQGSGIAARPIQWLLAVGSLVVIFVVGAAACVVLWKRSNSDSPGITENRPPGTDASAPGGGGLPGGAVEDPETQVRAVLARWHNAVRDGDLESDLSFYARNIERYYGYRGVTREELREKKRPWHAARSRRVSYGEPDIKVVGPTKVRVEEDVEFADCRRDRTFDYEAKARARLTWVKAGDTWKIILHDEVEEYYRNEKPCPHAPKPSPDVETARRILEALKARVKRADAIVTYHREVRLDEEQSYGKYSESVNTAYEYYPYGDHISEAAALVSEGASDAATVRGLTLSSTQRSLILRAIETQREAYSQIESALRAEQSQGYQTTRHLWDRERVYARDVSRPARLRALRAFGMSIK